MKLLNIPFISKPKAKSFTKWIAKYLINENNWKVEDEWVELLEWTEFRGKEKYWEKFNKNIIEFRKKIMYDDRINEKLSGCKLKEVNSFFLKNIKTVLSHDSYTTWSNPSWSESNIKGTPYLIYWWKYNQFMFINFFKILRTSLSWKKIDRNMNDIQTISLEEYLNLYSDIKQNFNDFNKILYTALESDELNDETLNIDNSPESKDYINLVLSDNYKLSIEDEEEKNKQRISRLRRIFKNRLRNIKPSDHLFWQLPEDMCEAAHIYPVSAIKKMDKQNWYMIADENNWINLPIQIHKLYDSNKIYFNEKWEIIFTNKHYKDYLTTIFCNISESKLKDNILNNQRINYIKKYNKELLKL